MAQKTPPPTQTGFDPAKLYVWVKGLESKVNNLFREVELLKNDFMRKNSELTKEIKIFNEDLLELKREQAKSNEKTDLIIKELKKTAGLEELTVIKKYLDFWNPMNFVTQKDLDRALNNKILEIGKNLKETKIIKAKEIKTENKKNKNTKKKR